MTPAPVFGMLFWNCPPTLFTEARSMTRLLPPRLRLSLLLTTLFVPVLAFLALARTAAPGGEPAAPKLELKPGDHICLVGNTLAERMQHDGWLETYLHSRFVTHDLVIRNLGFSGDELTTRLRSSNFGTPDQWLTATKADVIFAFFGYNESFAGQGGLEKFKKDLDAYLKNLLAHKYNGKSAPRVVLFSPIAHEDLHDRNLPDGAENNKRLALYTAAMAEVAKANKVVFVNLFEPSKALCANAPVPLTFNGVHLTDHGDEQIAKVIDGALFSGQPEPTRPAAYLAKLRTVIKERGFYWYNRYRTVDGYSIYGGRADLKFVGGQTNRVVMQREMEVLDQMTANRDKVVWAAAQGKEGKADDSNLPPFIPVETNKPGPLAGGKHKFLEPADESIAKMTVHKGMKVNLFASEKDFPELTNPVQMQWDTKGRLWVAVWPTYPHWKPGEPMNDKILILEDTKGTGKADKCTVFADGLHCPTGFEFWNGGVIVAQAPSLVFMKDSKGGDKADIRLRILGGLDTADTHHTANSFVLDPGGALYMQEGTFHHTQVETPWGPPVRNANAGVFRYEPRAQKFEVYVNFGFANPHGHVFDRWGHDIVVDGTGAQPYDGALFSGFIPYPQRHNAPPRVYNQKTRPCAGIEILSSKHFPDEMQGNLLVTNVIGFQGILRYKLSDQGASVAGTEQEPILSSSDPSFRPSDVRIGSDGAIYFLDWHNPIIGHMQHNLRDPSRDREHGRIYRVTYEGRPLSKSPKVYGESIAKLLDLLKEPEDRVRYRARAELTGRDSEQVIAAAKQWVEALDKNDANYEHHLLEALWLHQSHNFVNVDLLTRVLAAKDGRARAAATRVLCYWRDRVPGSLELLKQLAADKHPRVRLEAVRASSFYSAPEAIEVMLVSMEHPTDLYLDFVRAETNRALDPYVKKAIAAGGQIPFTTNAGARYFLKNVATEDLLKMKRTAPVFIEMLARKGVRDEARKEAIAGLAKLENKTELVVLLGAIHAQDEAAQSEESVVFDLVRLLTDRGPKDLASVRGNLEKLATEGKNPVTRQLGYVALVAADGNVDKAWALGTKSVGALQDVVNAVPLVRDAGLKAELYPKVLPLLEGLPKDLADKVGKGKSVLGRYVRIEIPGKKKVLTLAEVEVISEDGRNVARGGKATQKTTAHGGEASRAIDGNKSGVYGDGGQTHTEENGTDPWWEVDLGNEYPIASIAIWNRTDDELGKRLNGFTLQVLDKNRNVIFERKKQPAPAINVAFEVGTAAPERIVRRAAMTALVSVRGQEAATFKALAAFLKDGADRSDRHAAVQAMLRIPTNFWPKDDAGPLVKGILEQVRKVPVAERTTPEVVDTLQFADSLASLLPLKDAKAIRKELGELGVRVLRIGTLHDQMLFDKERIVVKAGKQVEILFENTDIMPHNLVFLQPGALEEIGNLAEQQATQPGAMERGYVPSSAKVMHATKLLQPREAQKLAFVAPTKPGVYAFVCTYPGHWRRMYGAMYVVEDLDEYLADPPAYLAKNPLPVADELLKFTRPRTEWKFDDLATSVEKMEGRSFNHGKQTFTVANCVACHKMNGVGTEVGPDLTKIEAKFATPRELLKKVLEPSHRINEKYQSWVIETQAGKVITGMIVEEKDGKIKVLEDPLAKKAPLVLKEGDIAAKKKSPTSIMPKGLLDTLTREEVLDLMAYLVSRGDPQHPVFMGGHDHKHRP
jgi:putative heme-binding domain-containing protein